MKRAFTLVEAVIVLAIVLFLAAVLLPVFARRNPGYAPRSGCQSNLKQIGLGFMQYIQDYPEKLPLVARKGSRGWGEDLQPYLKSYQLFQCPSGATRAPETSDYFYNSRLSGAKLESLDAISLTIAGGDGPDDAPLSSNLSQLPPDAATNQSSFAQRHLDGANYSFVDGHVKWFKPEKISTKSASQVGIPTFSLR